MKALCRGLLIAAIVIFSSHSSITNRYCRDVSGSFSASSAFSPKTLFFNQSSDNSQTQYRCSFERESDEKLAQPVIARFLFDNEDYHHSNIGVKSLLVSSFPPACPSVLRI